MRQLGSNAEELIRCQELRLTCKVLPEDEGRDYIKFAIEKFKPQKISGHLSIYNESVSIPIEGYEFSYSQYLKNEPVLYIFRPRES